MSTTLPIQIIQGGSRLVNVFLTDGDTGVPRDLTTVTEISAKVVAAAGGCVTKLLSLSQIAIVSATKGQFKIKFLAADTTAMILTSDLDDPSAYVSLHLEVTDSADDDWKPKAIEIPGAFDVQAASC